MSPLHTYSFLPFIVIKICPTYYYHQIIDSNMSTIRVLEPLQQEILQLQTLEEAVGQTGSTVLSPKFNFQLDKRGLTTVHLNAITR